MRHYNSWFCFWSSIFLTLAWPVLIPLHAQTTNGTLGTTALLVGPMAGTNSVVLAMAPTTAGWTATTDASWLHLSLANQSGIGSTNIIFSYDADSGPTRSNSLIIAGQTLTVTQAGSTYVQAGVVTALATSGLSYPVAVAVDAVGNVYVADATGNAIRKWTAANNTLTTLINSNVPYPVDLTFDNSGNLYIACDGNGEILEWTAATSRLSNVAEGSVFMTGMAVDRAGDVYSVNSYPDNDIEEWPVPVSKKPPVFISGLDWPTGARTDVAGNLYISEQDDNSLQKWSAANGSLTTLVSNGLNIPATVSVDGSGNVFIADFLDNAIKEWTSATGSLSTVATVLGRTDGVAVDGAGNVFFSDVISNQPLNELPYVFVDPTRKLEGLTAGIDTLPTALPATANLLPPFAPTSSDPTWLTIVGVTNGVVTFSFTADSGSARTGFINLFGQNIPVIQGLVGTPPNLSSTQLLSNGAIQFVFTNMPGTAFTILTATNLALPLNEWTAVGMASNIAPTVFQFTSSPTTNDAQRFYRVVSP